MNSNVKLLLLESCELLPRTLRDHGMYFLSLISNHTNEDQKGSMLQGKSSHANLFYYSVRF